jgi:hypothetical protein
MGKSSIAGRANRYQMPPRTRICMLSDHSQRQIVLGKLLKGVTECVVLMIALTALAQPALARSYLNCSTRKVILISAPTGNSSATIEDEVAFVTDEAAKGLTFSDSRPLTVTRLDKY